MWSSNRRKAVSLGRGHRRRAWRRFQTLALPVLAVAAVLAWAWPTYFADSLPTTGVSGSSETPRVLKGGDAWGGATPSNTRIAKGTLSGPVTHVRDGDTIEVSRTPVRIANLDCPEAGTAAGNRATQAMHDLVRGRRVSCALQGRWSYDREIGTCRLSNGPDLGSVLISQGVCQRWR